MTRRIAVIDRETCRPATCDYLCKRVCPINRSGEDCVTISEKKPFIDEPLCIGCGICSQKCPTKAISIVNLPSEMKEPPVHRYGRNQFALFRLPIPRHKMVVGLVGQNGIGKSTAIKILAGELRPNMGVVGRDTPFDEVIDAFKGTELQEYLVSLKKKGVKVAYKPQSIDSIPRLWKGRALELLMKTCSTKKLDQLTKSLNIGPVLSKDVGSLSGGELQMLAIAATMARDADLYFFDEPSSYLDVEQRLMVAREIRKLAEKSMVIVIEHDLAVADYLADHVHILYGRPGCFGIISKPYGVRNGINTYLEGFIREENVRFRDDGVTFGKGAAASMKTRPMLSFPAFTKKFDAFSLRTEAGVLYKGEIIGILGPNATGKTTFINLLAGKIKPDSGRALAEMKLAYKPQRITLDKEDEKMTAKEFLQREMSDISSPNSSRIMHVLGMERLLEREMGSLSGGELQTVLIASALGKEFDILLLDEPTAFLDVEQRLRAGKLIREIIETREAAAFVVDHDLQILDAVSDRLMVFDGERGIKGFGNQPAESRDGMNRFLKKLGITFRRDPQTGRARANKPDSVLDRNQKESGEYFYLE